MLNQRLKEKLVSIARPALCSLIILATAALSAPAEAKIAFTSDRDGQDGTGEIYVMNDDGSNQTRLTFNDFGDVEPSFSGDGSKITFRSERDGNWEIYIMNADGTNQTRLTDNSTLDFGPKLSHDGSKITFMSEQPAGRQIFVMDADGSNQVNISNDNVGESEPTFSPDDSKILFRADYGGGHDITIMEVDGTNRVRLTSTPSGSPTPQSEGPENSPDGSKLVFHSNRDGDWEIYIANSDGTGGTRLTNSTGYDTHAVFSPDSGRLAFHSVRTGLYEIFTMNVDGTDLVQLTADTATNGEPSWASGNVPNLPTVTINNVTSTEGNSGTTDATFTVTLNAAKAQPVTVNYATANNTAKQPADYTIISGTLNFAAGETTKTILVPIVGDTSDEANETFFVNLSSATNATIADSLGVGIITDDDALPTLSIGDATAVMEDGAGARNSLYVVTLSGATNRTVKVNYATGISAAVGSATSGVDFTAVSGTMTFAPGQTTKTIVVPVLPDNLDETNEVIRVNLSGVSLASITKGQGVGSITDNDATPTLSITDVMQNEGNSGTTNFVFTVSLSAASGQTVTASYQTDNGTAIKPGDYTGKAGTLTFAPGETIKTISVVVKGEVLNEADETFLVNLSNAVNASFAKNQGTGTILNDDASG